MTVHVKQDFGRGRNFNMEQRAMIKFNAKLGKSASETFRSMQQVYGSQCLGCTAVFEWHKRFLEGRETLEDDKKSGRPILVRTPEMIEKVRYFIANVRNASLKMMEEALNISRETIRTILHEDLGKTKVCAKFVPHTLRSDQKSARINYSRDIVAAAENNPNFLKSIVTGDETWCFQYDPETKRQSAEWESKNSASYLPSQR
ncbi:SETMR methyltransferase, partial [Acromyrmex heyeri]